MRRSRRSGVEDLRHKTVHNPDGTTAVVPSKLNGKGSRWRARYADDSGQERTKRSGRNSDATKWLDTETAEHVSGIWADPKLSAVTFGVIAEAWIKTKATRSPKTVAGYRSLLDTLMPRDSGPSGDRACDQGQAAADQSDRRRGAARSGRRREALPDP